MIDFSGMDLQKTRDVFNKIDEMGVTEAGGDARIMLYAACLVIAKCAALGEAMGVPTGATAQAASVIVSRSMHLMRQKVAEANAAEAGANVVAFPAGATRH